MKKCLFIFNPNTGGGRLKNKLMQIICEFSQAGYELQVWPTQKRGDAKQIAAEKASLFDLVVCCGGDGTLNETVDGLLAHSNPPLLGYIPGGTTNDFASSLHLPKADMIKATHRVLHPKKIFNLDIGSLNNRIFTYVAAFGAFTDVSYNTPQAFKNLLGYFAYLVEGVQRLPNLKPFAAKITTDEGELEGDFLFGMVANSTSVGGFQFKHKGKVKLDDGFFEMVLVRQPHNIADLGALSAAILTQNFSSPLLELQRIKKLTMHSSSKTPWTLDGEFGGQYTESVIQVKHEAIKICI